MKLRLKPPFRWPDFNEWRWWAMAGLWAFCELAIFLMELAVCLIFFVLPIVGLFAILFVAVHREALRAFLETLL